VFTVIVFHSVHVVTIVSSTLNTDKPAAFLPEDAITLIVLKVVVPNYTMKIGFFIGAFGEGTLKRVLPSFLTHVSACGFAETG